MNKSITLMTLLGLLISSFTALAMEKPAQKQALTIEQKRYHQGKDLHDKRCTSCHKENIYTREDRMVKTMSALEYQVNNCMKGPAKAEWTKPETTSVIEYLNSRFYKF